MRQVPHYLLVGNGRVARHFQHYFSLLGLSFGMWQRNQPTCLLQQQLTLATHVLILITDEQIEKFIAQYLPVAQALLLHFSGSLVSTKAYGAHPLMTFNQDLYSLAQYQAIPFVIDEDAPEFAAILPGLPNTHMRLPKALKAKYHALCVLSGNFSCLLWQKLFHSLEQEFHFPPAMAHLYLQQQTNNLLANPQTAFTGPLIRNDWVTVEKNLTALAGDPFQKVYESFVLCYQQLTAATDCNSVISSLHQES